MPEKGEGKSEEIDIESLILERYALDVDYEHGKEDAMAYAEHRKEVCEGELKWLIEHRPDQEDQMKLLRTERGMWKVGIIHARNGNWDAIRNSLIFAGLDSVTKDKSGKSFDFAAALELLAASIKKV